MTAGDQCAGVRGLLAVTLASPLAGCVTLRGPFASPQALLIHLARWPLCESLPHFQGAVTCFDSFYFLFIWVRPSSLQRVGSSLQRVGSSLQRVGSVTVVHGLSRSSARGILVPGPRIETVSLALQGRFLTTGPPWKSCQFLFKIRN